MRYPDSNRPDGHVPPEAAAMHARPPLDLTRVQPMQHDAAYEYDSFLGQLTFNSKEVITNLTRIAGENMHAADAISSTIEQRCFHAPPHAKLPFLYLMDSIVKNIGANYLPCFARNLFNTFTSAYIVVPPQIRMSMHRLLNTWPPFFGMDMVHALRRAAADHDNVAQQRPPHLPPGPPQSALPPHGLRMPPPPQMHPSPAAPGLAPVSNPMANPGGNVPAVGAQPFAYRPGPPPSRPTAPHLTSHAPPLAHVHTAVSAPSRLGLRSQPAVSSGGPAPSAEVMRVQAIVADISRKASMGTPPSNHQLFSVNRLITTLLQQSSASPAHRDVLMRLEQQLRDLVANPRPPLVRQVPPPQPPAPAVNVTAAAVAAAAAVAGAPPLIPPFPSSTSAALAAQPTHNPSALPHSVAISPALTSLLHSMPSGLLSSAKSPSSTSMGIVPHAAHLPRQPMHVAAPPSHLPSRHPVPSGALPPVPHRPAAHIMHQSGSSQRVASPISQSFASPSAPPPKYSELKTISHAPAVRALYTELPHLSKSDGMRFATTEGLRDHLDWLFRRNRLRRARRDRLSIGGSSRCWFDTLAVFLGQTSGPSGPSSGVGTMSGTAGNGGGGSGGNATNNPNGSSAPSVSGSTANMSLRNGGSANMDADQRDKLANVISKDENEVCQACRESFETFWDDDQGAWMLRDAVRTEDGDLFHTKCFESAAIVEVDEEEDVPAMSSIKDEMSSIKHEAQTMKQSTAHENGNGDVSIAALGEKGESEVVGTMANVKNDCSNKNGLESQSGDIATASLKTSDVKNEASMKVEASMNTATIGKTETTIVKTEACEVNATSVRPVVTKKTTDGTKVKSDAPLSKENGVDSTEMKRVDGTNKKNSVMKTGTLVKGTMPIKKNTTTKKDVSAGKPDALKKKDMSGKVDTGVKKDSLNKAKTTVKKDGVMRKDVTGVKKSIVKKDANGKDGGMAKNGMKKTWIKDGTGTGTASSKAKAVTKSVTKSSAVKVMKDKNGVVVKPKVRVETKDRASMKAKAKTEPGKETAGKRKVKTDGAVKLGVVKTVKKSEVGTKGKVVVKTKSKENGTGVNVAKTKTVSAKATTCGKTGVSPEGKVIVETVQDVGSEGGQNECGKRKRDESVAEIVELAGSETKRAKNEMEAREQGAC